MLNLAKISLAPGDIRSAGAGEWKFQNFLFHNVPTNVPVY